MNWVKKSLNSPSFPVCLRLAMWIFQPLSSNGRVSFLNSWIWVWPHDLFWSTGSSKKDAMPVPDLGPKGLPLFLEIYHHLMNKPRLACWRMRHLAQSSPSPQTSLWGHSRPASCHLFHKMITDSWANPVKVSQVWSWIAEPLSSPTDSCKIIGFIASSLWVLRFLLFSQQ